VRDAECALGDRALAAGHDVRPGAVCVHGEDQRAAVLSRQ
jgi:hypothetical protein